MVIDVGRAGEVSVCGNEALEPRPINWQGSLPDE